MAINYTAKQSDCISSIAFEHGFFPDTIWNHPNNAGLKKKRENPNVLMPGDVVFVPDKRLKEVSEATNQVHKYRVKNTPAKIRIQFLADGKPKANAPYTLTLDGAVVSQPGDRTDSQGVVARSIPPGAKQGVISVGTGDDCTEYNLQLGSLNPANEVSGVKQRLRNLGLYNGSSDQTFDEKTRDAVRAFQSKVGLNVTGELDDSTKDKLEQIHDK